MTVEIPKVRAKTGEPVTFRSALVLPYVRKTKSFEAALPWLYLKGGSRRSRGFDYLAKVVTGIKFKDGIKVTKVDQAAT